MKRLLEKIVIRLLSFSIINYHKLIYSRFKPGHIFDISVDDMSFKMTFMDYKLGETIIERIEGRRERETTATIKSLVQNGSKVLELGGCYGYFTMIMSKCAGPEGKVVSIEGTPNNCQILNENIRLNNITNVSVYNLFVTSKSTSVSFNSQDRHPYDAIDRIERQENSNSENYIAVPSVRLSNFLQEIDFIPDYIFMDIEGFEVEVFEDFSGGYFKSNRPVIVFEVHNPYYKEGKNLSFIEDILKQNSYTFRRIAGNMICFPL